MRNNSIYRISFYPPYFDVADNIGKEIYETNPVLIRLYHSYLDLVYFRLVINELDYYDLTPTPPIFKHYNL